MRFCSPTAIALACTSLAPLAGAFTQEAAAGTVAALTTQRVAFGLNRPIFATHAPGDTERLFIVEQRGVIKILDLTTETVLGTSFLDINSLVAGPSNSFDERGLLGLAFHPDYQINGYFYVYYTNNSSNTFVARYSVSLGDPNVADSSSAQGILFINQPQTNHNGGWMGFSPVDGYLYIATGDGGNFCDTGPGHTSGTGNAQDITANLLGKMLRIIPSTAPGVGGYTVPPSNPFVGVNGDDEIWSYGLRNPWRSSFDRDSGDLYIADVGQDAREEVNYAKGSSTGRENYGWRCMEGNSCSSISGCSTTGCTCGAGALIDPVHVYAHNLGFSITGGYVYRGCDIPSLRGTYFFADFGTSRIWSFLMNDGAVTEFTERTSELDPPADAINSISSFGEDALGEMYIVQRGSTSSGEIWKIIRETGLGDFNCDRDVGVVDLLQMLGAWGPCIPACPEDLDRNGEIGVTDLLLLLGQWGPTN